VIDFDGDKLRAMIAINSFRDAAIHAGAQFEFVRKKELQQVKAKVKNRTIETLKKDLESIRSQGTRKIGGLKEYAAPEVARKFRQADDAAKRARESVNLRDIAEILNARAKRARRCNGGLLWG